MPAHLHLASDSVTDGVRTASLPIKVVLAVGHAGARRSLRRLLDDAEDIEVVADVADVSDATRSMRHGAAAVLVVDLWRSNAQSCEEIRRLRCHLPAAEIVVLTMEESPLSAQKAIDAGAVGFVLKDRADSELLVAVRCAAAREEFISSRVAAGLDALRRAVGGDGLSPRDTEVVRLIALGHTSAEIAAKLQLSRRTVETQRAKIFTTLGVTTRAELVRFALRRRLIGS
ncbi:MAG TPA: response regulator transcription factor [Solirubrobacteraceae bacterium]|nr:response regulator transcription factor [Solirubrobacteraceae bacterium]